MFDKELVDYIANFEHFDALEYLYNNTNVHQQVDRNGFTLLHLAAEFGNHVVVDHLVQMGAQVNARNRDGETPVALAIQAITMDRNTLVDNSMWKTIEILLKGGAHLGIPDDSGKDCMDIIYNRNIVIPDGELQFLFSDYIEKSKTTEFISEMLIRTMDCPVYHSIWWADPQLTVAILAAGIDVNSTESTNQETALHLATSLADRPNVKQLLDSGADVNAKDADGRTPIFHHFNPTIDSEDNSDILCMLMNHGSILYDKDKYGSMQLKNILTNGVEKNIDILLHSGINFLAKDGRGRTPLHYMAANRNGKSMNLLRGKNFDVNVRDNEGSTPLHVAVSRNCLDNVKFLLNNGAEVNARTITNETPLHSAVKILKTWDELTSNAIQDRQNIVEHLLEHGAMCHSEKNEKNTVFHLDEKDVEDNFYKPILMHLVAQNVASTAINPCIYNKILSKKFWKMHFNFYDKLYKIMKRNKIHGAVTFSHFLFQSNERIICYASNGDVLKRLQRFETKATRGSYWKEFLKRRITRAIKTAKVKRRAAFSLGKAMNVDPDCYSVILNQILCYVNHDDLESIAAAGK